MGFLGIANAYSMRSVLSVAITEMVGDIHKTKVDPNGCPGPNKSANTTNVVSSVKIHLSGLIFIYHVLFRQDKLLI